MHKIMVPRVSIMGENDTFGCLCIMREFHIDLKEQT